MKTFATLIRHAVTYLVGLLVAWFAIHLTAPDDLKAATDAANALVEPLCVVAGFVAVILTRLAMPFFSRLFRLGSGETEDKGSAGGLSPCVLLWIGMTVAFMGSLPSCSPAELDAARAVPITFHLVGPDGSVGYSSKGGLVISGRITADK
jgi:hypothetical protein